MVTAVGSRRAGTRLQGQLPAIPVAMKGCGPCVVIYFISQEKLGIWSFVLKSPNS